MDNPKRILIAPLNWGLGHATRCMPIIKALIERGAVVFLASDGVALHLLEKEYPELPAFELPAYGIRYPGHHIIRHLFWQMPRMLLAIRKEKQVLRKIIKEQNIDIVISDNRYGCLGRETYNIIITHQLHIKVPFWLLKTLVGQVNRFLLKRFDECWIPDLEESPNLSGDLSHPQNLPNAHYLGLLSRMKFYDSLQVHDLVIVLSGPEPQRTYLEQKILAQLRKSETKRKVLLVQGITNKQERIINKHIEIVSYLTSRDLNDAMLGAQLILCRSGYSSLMDLAQLERRALLIPTPGQTEQEYLADYLMEHNLFYTVSQKELNLEKDIPNALKYSGFPKGRFLKGNLEERLGFLVVDGGAVDG